MNTALGATRFSVLDRSLALRGQSPARALRASVRFARRIEALGYHRFWVAEHHGVPGVAGSAPTVLAAAIASATSTIRVGTGGVMLPNHRPLVVAEQFGVLESLFPGRVDMGLGRSVGFTAPIRRALGADRDAAEDFARQVTELLGHFAGPPAVDTGVHAYPAEGLRVPAFVLATGRGAVTAGELGLPLVIAPAHGQDAMLRAIDDYRAAFRPSIDSAEPYVVLALSVAVAEDDERARRLHVPEAWSEVYSRTHGVFPPLSPADEIEAAPMTDRERERLAESVRGRPYGTREHVADLLGAMITRAGADEVLVSLGTFDQERRLDSYRRLAELANLTPRPARIGRVVGSAHDDARA